MATSEKVVSELTSGERTSSFIQYTKQRAQEIYNEGNIRNYKKYNGFCNKLEVFLTDEKGRIKDLAFAEITTSFLSKYEVYLHSLRNERQPDKKLHPNTIKKEFVVFRALIRRAIEVEGLLKPERNPFLTYKVKGVNTTKERLNEAEIKLIEEYELEEGCFLWHCRNYFLFSFYCAGIRAADLIQLRWGNVDGGRLRYQMGKNHKGKDMILIQKAKSILGYYRKGGVKAEDYVFPLLNSSAEYAKAITQEEKDTMRTELKAKLLNQTSSKNALINKGLKNLAVLIGVEKKISMHCARHSFAKIAKQKGTDNSILKEMFAHSSVKVTEGYMGDFDTSETDEALVNIFEEKNDVKVELISLLDKMSEEDVKGLIKKIKGK